MARQSPEMVHGPVQACADRRLRHLKRHRCITWREFLPHAEREYLLFELGQLTHMRKDLAHVRLLIDLDCDDVREVRLGPRPIKPP